MSSLAGELGELVADLVEALLRVLDEVHLVDAQHEVLHLQQRRDHRVAARLLEHALAGVDEHEREVGGRRAGDHVARVLHVPGRVGDDELAPRRREVAVRDVDRDALLALGAQAVGEQREVGVVEALVAARALDRLELVLEDLLGVEQQPADERALAVVDRAGRREPQQLAHLEVALALAVFHGGLGELVVGAGRAALGDPRRRDLGDHLVDGRRASTRPRRCTSRRRPCGSAPSSRPAPRRPSA